MNAAEVDVVVIGAGAVGLACAAAFARAGREVLVLEAAGAIGTGVSSRNSEVIHGGLYYPHNSLKHLMCVEGRQRLYDYVAARGVAHRKCGKLIVATSAREDAEMDAILGRARANGVQNVSALTRAEALALEPNLNCTSALLSAETGIIDSAGYMRALLGEIEDAGGGVALHAPVLGGALSAPGAELNVGGDEPMRLTCRTLINAAGLNAQRVAASLGFATPNVPKLVLAKGNYFSCAMAPAFTRLIYPAPVDGGLGVHLTLDLGGRMRFGPDVEWIAGDDPSAVDYSVNPQRAESFYAAIRTYWPALKDGALTPDYSGLRPKLSGKGEAAADFRIDGPEIHGAAGVVNLFGIESPGLTSSLAIAERVRSLL